MVPWSDTFSTPALLREFLVEIASELGPLDCDRSASENDTALDGVEETAPIESCAAPKISWR